MTKEQLLHEYKYYYENYLYYDITVQKKDFAQINLAKCNLLADLFLRYYEGHMEDLQDISLQVNEKHRHKQD